MSKFILNNVFWKHQLFLIYIYPLFWKKLAQILDSSVCLFVLPADIYFEITSYIKELKKDIRKQRKQSWLEWRNCVHPWIGSLSKFEVKKIAIISLHRFATQDTDLQLARLLLSQQLSFLSYTNWIILTSLWNCQRFVNVVFFFTS